jgi:hypothetical protein
MAEDIFVKATLRGQRLTQKQKNANDKKWYKEQADMLDNHSASDMSFVGFGGVSETTRKKVNYELFNNRLLDMKELAYVCKPFGDSDIGELPANMVNRDIVSPKIKVLLGMEMGMPFSHKVIAVNEEATTRKEQQEFGMLQDFVTAQIMKPIRMQIEAQAAAQTKGKPLTPEEQQQIQAQVEEQLQAKTPEEVRKYMARDHQDPAEVMMHQILEYLMQEQKIQDKFNKAFKHALLGGELLYHVGGFNGKPSLSVVNPIGFECDRSEGLEGIEDGQWATNEYRWTPNEVISKLGSEMTDTQMDRVYTYEGGRGNDLTNADFTFSSDRPSDGYTVRVMHLTWKSLGKIGFLRFNSAETGKEELMLVDENYKLNEMYGDIDIQWEWIPETHEAWKVLDDIYVYCRPVPGQHKDINNLWEAKLPYYGALVDATNSEATSAMDRIKSYQYYYDIILYRIELLMASDKGKILAMNIKAIPKSAGIDTKKFIYFMEANKLAMFNPSEEGNRGAGGDVTNMVKEIDMSLASDIQKYISLAEYIETKCGAAIGVTKAMEGAIGPTDAVTNTKQNLIQASHIVKPYFDLHNTVKGKVLQGLIDTAKTLYSENPPGVLSYVLDDMSVAQLTVDRDLLDSSSYGLFVGNSVRAEEAKQAIIQLAQAGLQNQQIDLLDVFKIIKSTNLNEAEEQLIVGRQIKAQELQQGEQAKLQANKEAQDAQMNITREQWAHEADMIRLKAKEDRKTKVQVEAMAAMGFDPNKDEDSDGTPDVLEVAKFGVDADIKAREQDRKDEEFEHKKEIDKKKLENDKEKISVSRIKKNSSQ